MSERVNFGMDAVLGGSLEVLGGCLGVGGVVVVWPHGTDVVDEDPVTIEIPGMGRYTVGDQVEIGGGGGREDGRATSGRTRRGRRRQRPGVVRTVSVSSSLTPAERGTTSHREVKVAMDYPPNEGQSRVSL